MVHLKMDPSNRRFLLETTIFRFYSMLIFWGVIMVPLSLLRVIQCDPFPISLNIRWVESNSSIEMDADSWPPKNDFQCRDQNTVGNFYSDSLPSWELTYPLPRHFMKFSKVGYVSSLEGCGKGWRLRVEWFHLSQVPSSPKCCYLGISEGVPDMSQSPHIYLPVF